MIKKRSRTKGCKREKSIKSAKYYAEEKLKKRMLKRKIKQMK